MKPRIEALFDCLHRQLEQVDLSAIEERCRRSLQWQEVDRPPVIVSAPLPMTDEFPFRPYPMSETFDNPEKMLYNELVHAFEQSIAASRRIGHDLPWTVRANYGTVLVASMYGARVEQVGENPPWVRHDGVEAIPLEAICEDTPETLLSRGWFQRVRSTMQSYHELLANYPELKRAIRITLPDLQGPFDNFEHVLGNDVFLDMVDDPEACAQALAHVAQTQVLAAKALEPLVTDGPDGFSHQHGFMQRGHILLRCDSVIMLSAKMYAEQVACHDNWVMEQMGGGAIHSCGNISHLWPEYLKLPALRSLDLGQSEMNDRDAIYAQAKEKQIAVIRIHATVDEWRSGNFQSRYPTGVFAIIRAQSAAEAESLKPTL